MSANYSRTAPVLSGLPAWEENIDEIDDYEGDEGDGEGFGGDGEDERDIDDDDEDEENPKPVSFEEARGHLDAMNDWIDFMSRKFTTREADMIYKRLKKLSKYFRPPPGTAATAAASGNGQEKEQKDAANIVTVHTTSKPITSHTLATASTTQSKAKSASNTSSSVTSTSTTSTSTPSAASSLEKVPLIPETTPETSAVIEDEDPFAKWPSASGLIRANVSILPSVAQNLIIEYDARLWFHASTDVVKVCPGWVAINVDRCIWGCLDKGWLDYRLEQAGKEGGSDDYMWLKFLRMHRALDVFPQAATERLFGEYEDMLEGGPSFACDLCPGYKDITKKCKVCGIEKCNECTANDSRPMHYPGCEHFNEEEELKRQTKRIQLSSSSASVEEEENADTDDEMEEEVDEHTEVTDAKEGKEDTKESKTADAKEAKDEKSRDSKEAKREEVEEEGDEGEEDAAGRTDGLD